MIAASNSWALEVDCVHSWPFVTASQIVIVLQKICQMVSYYEHNLQQGQSVLPTSCSKGD